MDNKLIAALAFAGGAAAGAAAAWKLLTAQIEAKYKAIAEEEIESVKETFSRLSRLKDEPSAIEVKPEQIDDGPKITLSNIKWTRVKPNLTEYVSIIRDNGYDSADEDNKKEKGKEDVERPYVISPDEYGEMQDYEAHTLTYYADGVLADEYDETVENAEMLIGEDSLNHFGDYEDDAVHVRNDMLRSDYEVLRDLRNYSDISFKPPHLVD